MTYFWGLPGIGTARTASHRSIFLQRSENFLAQGRWIDGTKSRDPGNVGDPQVLRAGLIMGKITSGGLYAPTILGVTSGAYTSGGTTLTVSAAQAVEIARRIGSSGTATLKAVGPPTAAGTVAATAVTFSAVNQTTGALTVTSLGVDKVAGTFITAADGSETPLSFIPDWDYGVRVTDIDGTSLATVDFPKLPVSGIIDSSQFINWPSDTSLRAWIVANLNAAFGGQFIFDHPF